MKQVLKIILITFLCTIGGVTLFIGGAYLLGFLDEKIVYAEDLSFNQTEIISATTFSMRVDTSTEGVTRKEVTLMASPGGEDVINFPKTVNIGEDFYISPRTNSKNQNVGGVVELYCKYEDKKANQNAVATCKILIDVNVESCSVKLDTDQYQLGNNILLANIGTKIDNMLDVSPSNALKPYIDKSNIETETADSLFYKENFKDKKIFITLPSNAKFVINGVETGLNILELPYEYKYSELDKKYDLYVTKQIEIKPQQGELTVSCYACPTYKNQDNVTEETLRDKDKLANLKVVVGNFDILVKNYTVGSMTTNESKTIDIYYKEDVNIYLNNEDAEEGSLNLGVELFAKGDISLPIDPYLLRKYVFIEVVGTGNITNLNDSLYRLNNTTTSDEVLSADYDGISQDDKSTWGFKYNYFDFMAYYNYKNSISETDIANNRIELRVWYQNKEENDGEIIGLTSFYFAPKAREIDEISTKYESGKSQFVYKSGNSLNLSNSNFNITYANDTSASFNSIGYFINLNDSNTSVVTYPTKSGKYKAVFSFTPTISGVLGKFKGTSSLCGLAEAEIVLTQGQKTCTIKFEKDEEIYVSSVANLRFDAGKKIDVEIQSFNLKTVVKNYTTELFNVEIGGNTNSIKLKQIKFYDLNSDTKNETPILSVNGANIAGEFDFVEIDGSEYILLNTNKGIKLSSIGGFTLIAKNIYQDSETKVVYPLGKECNVAVYVYEEISSLRIYKYNADSKNIYENIQYGDGSVKVDENGDGGTLFITSDQLDTLKRLVELNRINFVVEQWVPASLVSSLTDEQKTKIKEKNKDTISFGEIIEVLDSDGKLLGYRIDYSIGNVYTLSVNNLKFENKFDASIQIDGADENNSTFKGTFVFDNNTTDDKWTFNVTDNVYDSIAIAHSYSGIENGNKDTPIKLTAIANSGSLYWKLSNNSSIEAFEIKCGYLLEDGMDTSAPIVSKTTLFDSNGISIENPAFYCAYDSDNKKIIFNNLPYNENGIVFKFQVYVGGASDINSFYSWDKNSGEFVQTLFEGLDSNHGYELYFTVVGLSLTITANNVSLEGISNKEYDFFGKNGLFSISGDSGILLDNIITCVISPDAGEDITLTNNYKKLVINNNFLRDEKYTFTFYTGQNSNKNIIKIVSNDVSLSNYETTIYSAWDIEVPTSFSAPSKDQKFATIKRKNGGEVPSTLSTSIMVESEGNFASVNEDNGTLNFKTITGSKTVKVILTLYYSDTPNVKKSIEYEIPVVSKYNDEDFVVGSKVEDYYQILAGTEYKIDTGIVLSGEISTDSGNIETISAVFSNATADDVQNIVDGDKLNLIDNTISTDLHIVSNSGNKNNFYFRSRDLNKDKYIKIVFNLQFNDGGTLTITKIVKIKGNLTITFKSPTEGNWKTNSTIDLGNSENYEVKSNNDTVTDRLLSSDFSTTNGVYTKNSFEYENQYFDLSNTSSDQNSICCLRVLSASESGLTAQTYETTISFTYQVRENGETKYTLVFDLSFTVEIITT